MLILILLVLFGSSIAQNSSETSENFKTDPCENFKKYVCNGDYKKDPDLLTDHSKPEFSWGKLKQKIDEEKHEAFSEVIKEDDIEPFQQVKKLYQSCINSDRINQRKFEPTLKLLKDIGGVPFLDQHWDEENWSLDKAIEVYPLLFEIFYNFYVKESTVLVKLNIKKLCDCTNFNKVLLDLGIPEDEVNQLLAQYNSTFDRIRMSSKVINLNEHFDEDDILNNQTNTLIYSVKRMDRHCARSHFCFRDLFPKRVQNTEFFINYDNYEIDRFYQILSRFSKRELANFIGLSLLNQVRYYLPEQYLNKKFRKVRKLKCLGDVNYLLLLAGNALHFKKFTTTDQNEFVLEFTDNLIRDYSDFIISSGKLEANQKESFKFYLKNSTVTLKLSDVHLKTLYKSFSTNETEYFEMALALRLAKFKSNFEKMQFNVWQNLAQLSEITNDDNVQWKSRLIYIPPSLSHPGFVNRQNPMSESYARLGFKIIDKILKINPTIVFNFNKILHDSDFNRITLARNHTLLLLKDHLKNSSEVELKEKLFWISLIQLECNANTNFTKKKCPGFGKSFKCPGKNFGITEKLYIDDGDNATIAICDTSICIKTANRIKEYTNQNVAPCSNFLEHACGGLKQNNAQNDRYQEISLKYTLYGKMREQRRRVLSADVMETDIEPIKLVKRYFVECTGKHSSLHLDSRGATPLLNLFSKLGGFPLLDGENWNENDWTPDKVLAGMPFLYFQIYWFLVKNDSIKVSMRTTNYALEPDYIFETLQSLSNNTKEIKQTIKEFNAFQNCLFFKKCEQKDHEIHIQENEMKYLVDSVERMNETCKSNEGCFNNLLPKDIDWNNVKITVDSENLQRIKGLIQRTPKRILANSFMIMIAHEQLKFLSNKFLKVRNIDRIKALKTTKFVQRWEFCVARVFNYMTHALMALHHQTYIKIELKTDVLKFVDEIFKNWEIAMKKFPELSEETRKSFFKRIRNYKIVVGCANEILDKNNLENFYKGWKTNETEFFELSTHLNTEYRKQKFRRLSKDFVDLTQYSKNVGFSRLNYFENFSVIDGTLYIIPTYLHPIYISKDNLDLTNYAQLGYKIVYSILSANFKLLFNKKHSLDHETVRHTLEIFRVQNERIPQNLSLPGLTKYSAEEMFYLILTENYCRIKRNDCNRYKAMSQWITDYKDIYKCNN